MRKGGGAGETFGVLCAQKTISATGAALDGQYVTACVSFDYSCKNTGRG